MARPAARGDARGHGRMASGARARADRPDSPLAGRAVPARGGRAGRPPGGGRGGPAGGGGGVGAPRGAARWRWDGAAASGPMEAAAPLGSPYERQTGGPLAEVRAEGLS